MFPVGTLSAAVYFLYVRYFLLLLSMRSTLLWVCCVEGVVQDSVVFYKDNVCFKP